MFVDEYVHVFWFCGHATAGYRNFLKMGYSYACIMCLYIGMSLCECATRLYVDISVGGLCVSTVE